jgi:hypothetical protein
MLCYILELFELTLPSQLRPAYMRLCDVLRKALFEFEKAPVLAPGKGTGYPAPSPQIRT